MNPDGTRDPNADQKTSSREFAGGGTPGAPDHMHDIIDIINK